MTGGGGIKENRAGGAARCHPSLPSYLLGYANPGYANKCLDLHIAQGRGIGEHSVLLLAPSLALWDGVVLRGGGFVCFIH